MFTGWRSNSRNTNAAKMEDLIFSMRLTARQLKQQSKKCEKGEVSEKLKSKTALAKGHQEIAKIHAENSIRNRNQHIAFLRLEGRIDSVVSRLQSAVIAQQVIKNLAGFVKQVDIALKSMNLQMVSTILDRFEKQMTNFDVTTATMEGSMAQTTTVSIPQADVDKLMRSIAEEAGIELNQTMPRMNDNLASQTEASTSQQPADDLGLRLARLRSDEP